MLIYICYFFDSNETTQIERRQEHIENHIKEAEKLDEIIRVLEEINKNLDGEKIKKFYNSDLYIKIIYGIPALVSGTFAFILFLIFTVQIIHESFFKEEISYEEMISQYRYNHRVFHEKDMDRMDRIIELMEEIKIKTDNN